MTKTELMNLGIATTDLDGALTQLKADIGKSAADYAKAKMAAEAKIQPLRARIQTVHVEVETPVDYVKTQIKTMPLASDSVSMDVQYFSRDGNEQDSSSFASTVSSFIAASTSWLGEDSSVKASAAAQKQVSEQVQKHSIAGTLLLSVSCSHKNASILAPFAIDVDKGIKAWNSMFPDSKLDPTNSGQMLALAAQGAAASDKKMTIISGMTFGSSFVGMVHVLNSTETSAKDKLTSAASPLQAKMDEGLWFENASGGFGVDSSISKDVKNLLSTQDVTSHVTLTCMGVIPSVVANDVQLGVQQFANFDPKSNMEEVATIQNATASDQTSAKDSAEKARVGAQMQSVKETQIKATLASLSDIKDASNKILDINSMMTALDDYLKKASAGDCGVPINYYLKDITIDMLAEM